MIDTSGYLPSVVRASAELLAGRVGRYLFVSTISVYEDAPVLDREHADPAAGGSGEPRPEPRLRRAEDALRGSRRRPRFPRRRSIVRPGLIVGAHDYSGRFSYWPRRVARGGEVLAPGRPETRIWLIDVRDLAEWTIRLVEAARDGCVQRGRARRAADDGSSCSRNAVRRRRPTLASPGSTTSSSSSTKSFRTRSCRSGCRAATTATRRSTSPGQPPRA